MRRLWRVSLAGTLLLAGLLFSVRFREHATLENSLVDMSILAPVPPDAVLVEEGHVLDGDLAAQTLTAAAGPYLLRGNVSIPPGITVRAEAGTVILARDNARLRVAGAFHARRTSFGSNQLSEKRRRWHGITAADGGVVSVEESTVRDASAALTCAAGGTLTVRGGLLVENAAGVVVLPDSQGCRIAGTRVRDSRVGFHLIGGTPTLTDVVVDRVVDGVRIFHEAHPTIDGLAVHRPLHTAIASTSATDTLVRGLDLPDTADRDEFIVGREDRPTHRWRGQDYPTGRVIVLE